MSLWSMMGPVRAALILKNLVRITAYYGVLVDVFNNP